MFEFEITELNRRVANMVRLGRVAAIDYAESVPKVRVRIEPLTTACENANDKKAQSHLRD